MSGFGERSAADWLALCRRSAEAAREAVARHGTLEERAAELGRGEGGDVTLAIDRAAEDAVLAEVEAVGQPLVVISEERGELALHGGGSVRVVVDPVDGSLNAKRGLPHACVSIAVADGESMDRVEVGYVRELDSAREWWAVRGEGASTESGPVDPLSPGPLEILGIETAHPGPVSEAAGAVQAMGARRVRALGSVAVTLCLVAEGKLDAMASLRAVRSVDAAAGQLLVREAGGAVLFPEADPPVSLGLGMRSRLVAARDSGMAERVWDAL